MWRAFASKAFAGTRRLKPSHIVAGSTLVVTSLGLTLASGSRSALAESPPKLHDDVKYGIRIPEKNIPLIFSEDVHSPRRDNAQARMERIARRAQHRITTALASIAGEEYEEKIWQREGKNTGGGCSRVLQGGDVLEKSGVNISISKGHLSVPAQKQMMHKNEEVKKFLESRSAKDGDVPFYAGSISSVTHPKNPHAPTLHFNCRYFELGEYDSNGEFVPRVWWFGGGIDLTPSVLYVEDARSFHQTLKDVCNRYDKSVYSKWKPWCDEYFKIPYRDERRGIGGVFFDDHSGDKEKIFNFIEDLLEGVIDSYVPILQKRVNAPFTAQEKEWQLVRRGRYAEFNLTTDRGTKFGLARKGANVEAILMSLPLHVQFIYNRPTQPGFEQDLERVLFDPVHWVPLKD